MSGEPGPASEDEQDVEAATVGRDFAHALAVKDFGRVAELLDPDVDFRALTPKRFWEAAGAADVVAEILPTWFGDSDRIEELAGLESGAVADRGRVAYRFRGTNEDGPFVLEQQAYFTVREGRIAWMRVLCSGYRPV